METPKEYKKEIVICDKLVNGYKVFCDKFHPLANVSGYIYYHRHVYSVHINRWIEKHEIVHHIDEKKTNNQIENLQLLSCFEHNRIHNPEKKQIACKQCGKLHKNDVYCSEKCAHDASEKINWPDNKNLEKLVWEMSSVKLSKILGVSDKAIEKRCKKFNILKPPLGYWRKRACNK